MQNGAEVVVRVSVVGGEPQRFPKLRRGLVELALHGQRQAEIVVSGRGLGIGLQRFLKLDGRLRPASRVKVQHRQRIAAERIARILAYELGVRREIFHRAACD